MSFASLLDHQVVLRRQVATGAETDYGQATTSSSDSTPFAAAIQPKGAREMIAVAHAGAPVGDHTIYCETRDIQPADAIIHVAASCPKAIDLPDGRYELTGSRNAVGRGHHLELDAQLVGNAGVAS